MTYLYNLCKPYMDRFFNREDGQGMAEYALILALVAVVAMVTLTNLGPAIAGKFTSITTKLGT